jgi:FkbM family methyltransferase
VIPAYLGFGNLSYPYRFETREGDCVDLETFEDLVTAWMIFIRHDYPVSSKCRTIVDAGANIGVFSLFAARSAPLARIIALEPFPTTFRRLQAHVQQSTHREQIECLALALCANDGRCEMDGSTMPSQFRSIRSLDPENPGVSVEAVTFETLIQRIGLERIDMLKIDIEGSEYEVFDTVTPAVARACRRIVLEYHPNGSKLRLFERLDELGFELVKDQPDETPGYGLARFQLRPALHTD